MLCLRIKHADMLLLMLWNVITFIINITFRCYLDTYKISYFNLGARNQLVQTRNKRMQALFALFYQIYSPSIILVRYYAYV